MFLLVLIVSLLNAQEFKEGKFKNSTNEVGFCYYNQNGCIEKKEVAPNATCVGDAFGTDNAVFKIPDYSFFICEPEGCKAGGAKSFALMRIAGAKKGFQHYGAMSINHFMSLMGNSPFCEDLRKYSIPNDGYANDSDQASNP